MNTMKSLQVVSPRTFEPVITPIPELDASLTDSLLIKTGWVSLCGSDIPFFTGNKRNKSYPLPAGAPIHECVGEVVKSTCGDFLPGDRVVAIPEGDRGLAQFFLAQSSKAVKLPPGLPDNGTASLVQPLSTVLNALDRLGEVKGKSVEVIGLGSIGLFFCWLLAQRGAESIIGVDPLKMNAASWQRSSAPPAHTRAAALSWSTPPGRLAEDGNRPISALKLSGIKWLP